jgi:catechol 2,3-dioxygenase-like lactoylglutathione lyase family enzyme
VIDHVTIRVGALEPSRQFYDRALAELAFARPVEGDGFVEWSDLSIAEARADRPVTRRLHVGLAARSPEHVDAWWRAMTGAGFRDDGTPGPRPVYGPDYYGAFVLDPDGNSVEAVHNGPARDGGVVDHLWIRVRELDEATRFYAALVPALGLELRELPGRTHVRKVGKPTVSLVDDGPPTEHVHLAFTAADRATVDAFHGAGAAGGYRSNGEPGERPEYHAGYYGAFLLDPDGNNVEAVFHER